MSQETINWLNNFTLVGFTDKRGKAWHYRESDQGAEPNHYTGEIPVEDVHRRLFGWEPMIGDVTSRALNEDGVFEIVDPERKAIIRPPRALGVEDEGAIMGVFKSGYQPHSYKAWLLDEVASILDDDLKIGSAGLLAKGAQAWVQVEVPENMETPEGIVFRPNLLATTSFDGSLATTYKRTVTNVVCDNTMRAGLSEKGQEFKIRHTRNSGVRLIEARDALAIVHTVADDFMAEVASLTSVKVSDGDWRKFLDEIAPMDDKEGRALTMATNKRDALTSMWNHDERVAPWKGTAWGVMQAMNTYAHHGQIVRGVSRAERNMSNAVKGAFDKLDAETRSTILAIAQ